MAAPSKPILGVDIRPEGIWAVEIRGSWSDAQVLNAAYASVPPAVFEGGTITDRKLVGQLVKDLVESMRTNTAEAILSIQEQSVDVRVMEVPQVPDNELRMVIEGELAHYQIFANQATALDFMRLAPGDDAPKESPQVLVVAAEKGAIEACTQIAESAELNLDAVEPVLFGQYRSAMQTLGRQTEDALIVSIGDTHSEIAILGGGSIKLYRRAAFGVKRLVSPSGEGSFPTSLASWAHLQQEGDLLTPPDGTDTAIETPDTINREAVGGLTMEIRRSLDYYFSQSPRAQTIVQGVLTVQNQELKPLAAVLSQTLNLRIDLAAIPQGWLSEPGVAEKIGDGIAYMGAFGIAMRHLGAVPASIPAFTLTTRARDEGRLQDVRRKLVFALAASIVSLFVGIFVSFNLGQRANEVEAQLKSKTGQLLTLQRIKQTRLESTLRQIALQKSLQSQGYPMPKIMDAIGGSLAADSSLVEITINNDGHIVLNGEAGSEKSIITTLESLKMNPVLQETMLDSFGTVAETGRLSTLERFQVTSRLVSSLNNVASPARTQ